MDARMMKSKNSVNSSPIYDNDEDYSSDEMVYTDDMQSDIEIGESYTGNQTKRLKSYANTDDLFRNRSKTTKSEQKSAIKRMPTRKPDPKVSNRNAIMARENRRKKKEHMEVLQKTVEDTQIENRKLKKMLSIRNNTISKLTQESLYLRSVLANKTEIMSLLRTIQGNRTPITSSVMSFVADHNYQQQTRVPAVRRISDSSSGCSPASSMSPSSYIEDDKENDLEIGSHTNFTTTETTAAYEQNINDFQWENLLSEPPFKSDSNPENIADLRDIDDSEILSG